MIEFETNTKKFIKVGMEEVEISTDDKPIIGTEALGTCVGILLYSPHAKKAIVGHCSFEVDKIIKNSIDLISQNNMGDFPIKFKIIPGYYYNHYDIERRLEEFYKSYPEVFIPFDNSEMLDNEIETVEELNSCRFAFDASIGEFVTDKVLFGEDYLRVNRITKK